MNIITNLCIFWDNIVNITIEYSSKSIVSFHGSMCKFEGALTVGYLRSKYAAILVNNLILRRISTTAK